VKPSRLEQLGQSETAAGPLRKHEKTHETTNKIEFNPIESPRKIAQMVAWQVGQCCKQEAHADVLCRRRRAVGAIAAMANLLQSRYSRQYCHICRAGPPQAFAEI
jgi:hypothetical protein